MDRTHDMRSLWTESLAAPSPVEWRVPLLLRRLSDRTRMTRPDYRLAIDPGDVHVGWAVMRYPDGQVVAGEWRPKEAVQEVRGRIAWWEERDHTWEVIVEEFLLYPNKAKEQGGSDFKTSQLIGALKLVCDDNGHRAVMQGATIKKPTMKQLRARGIKLVPGSTHAKDAQLHLWYRHLRDRGEGT